MTQLSASPEELTDEGREWLNRNRPEMRFSYACYQRDKELEIRKRGADAAFRYLTTRHRKKSVKSPEPLPDKPHKRGIGWYLAYPFAALCGFWPLVPEAPHEKEYEPIP